METASISSRAILDGALGPQQGAAVRPDDRASRFTVVEGTAFAAGSVRPDDRADRFAISDGSAPTASRTDARVSWDGALTLGIGTLVLVLALGLGLGYIRRPRIAGL